MAAELYYNVIEDVISKSKETFGDVDPQVFEQLRAIWSINLTKSKALGQDPEISRDEYSNTTPIQNTSAASLPRGARNTPRVSNINNPRLNNTNNFNGSVQMNPINSSNFQQQMLQSQILQQQQQQQQQQLLLQQQYQQFQQQQQLLYSNAPKFPGGRDINNSPHNLPQNDGPSDEREYADKQLMKKIDDRTVYSLEIDLRNVPQFDGNGDDEDDEEEEDEDAEGEGEGEEEDGEGDAEEGESQGDELGTFNQAQDDQLGEDLDDEEEDDSDVKDLVLCVYEKVSRVRNKWKCQLANGIMKIADKDYLFHKGSGDFEWS